jgi:hypothetical protein
MNSSIGRRRFLSGAGPARRAALVGVALFVFFIFTVGRNTWSNLRLVLQGEQAVATVTGHDIGNHNTCIYIFKTTDGVQHAGSDIRCAVDHPIGTPVAITYLASDPSDTTVGSPKSNVIQGLALIVLAPIGAFALLLVGSKLQANRDQRRGT